MTVKNKPKKITLPTLKPILEEEGDFYLETPEIPSHHTFRIFNQSGEILRGVYYADSKRGYTFLHRHEVREDWLSTTEHENLHAAIAQCKEWEETDIINAKMIEKYRLNIDDNEEHNMIRIALQEEEYFGE